MQIPPSVPPSPVGDAGVDSVGSATAQAGRGVQRRLLEAEAERLTWVAQVLAECEADVPEALHGSDFDAFVRSLAEGEVACTLGISLSAARELVWLAERLTTVMPCALEALAEARLDVGRVRVLADLTGVLDDDTAATVAGQLVSALDTVVWDGPSPRTWRSRVQKAVMRADQDAAARRRQQKVAARRMQAWAEDDGIGVLQVRTDASDIALVEGVLRDLAHAMPEADALTGETTTLDQRCADALVDLCRRVRDHEDLPQAHVRRVHDLGLVLHADTLFGDGPRRDALGELSGLGPPTPLDSVSSRELGLRHIASGTALQVLVVDATGALAHVVRLTDPSVCDSRDTLEAAVKKALDDPPPLVTDTYRPTAAIARHVRAEAPTCSFYDCPRTARSCDLDHDTSWPRGPTSVVNLDPKCRRTHQAKTHTLVRSTLHAGPGRGPRHVTWTLRNGIQVTTRPEPLPGCVD